MKAKIDLDEIVESWTLQGHYPLSPKPTVENDDTYKNLLLQLEFLDEKFFSRFVPALFPPHAPRFRDRLARWLANDGLTEDDQRLLFQIAGQIAYFSFDDFLHLYRSAFVSQVARWIIDQLGVSLDRADFSRRLHEERAQHTWYCPITDSMVISEFYHANGIVNVSQRPAFRALRKFGAPNLIVDYMAQHHLARLVLMEDFVGTGAQTLATVNWAVEQLGCPVLFVPLIVCPDGLRRLRELEAAHSGRLRVDPVLCLDQSTFVDGPRAASELLFPSLAELAKRVHDKIQGVPDRTYGPFGYHQADDVLKGGTVVLFSNTPDNSLPLIHHHEHEPSQWQALFPRVSRETP